ncbi:uncharacterized protein LOC133782861 [Humulus lupulus]|uniref:uncharacterized protein LOC133782861 n=1 Tax=Humulus lupulus TaxID=3486 RepID=UPI002B407C57|nr:uncharacterized protein LOC133782861 [Humulus lupulus]
MAEKPIFTNMLQNENYEQRAGVGEEEFESEGNACGCFGFGVFARRRRRSGGDYERETRAKTWLVKKMKKVKELSEVVAGPKWKNFIRKIGGYCNGNRKQKNTNRFQYDAQSYALNFDNGGFDDEEEKDEEDDLLLDFSHR